MAKQYIDPAKFVIVAVGNPKDFGTPLTSLGLPVSDIDLTIPAPKRPAQPPSAAVSGPAQPKGAALLAKMAEAMGGASKLSAVKDVTQKVDLNLDPAAGGLKVTQTELWLASGQFREENVLPFGKVIDLFRRQDRMGVRARKASRLFRKPSANKSASKFSACGPRC